MKQTIEGEIKPSAFEKRRAHSQRAGAEAGTLAEMRDGQMDPGGRSEREKQFSLVSCDGWPALSGQECVGIPFEGMRSPHQSRWYRRL